MKNPSKDHHQQHSLLKKLLPYALYAILSIALFRFFLAPTPPPLSPSHPFSSSSSPTPQFLPSSSSSPSPPPLSDPPPPSSAPLVKEEEKLKEIPPCDYTDGAWEQSKEGPLYNGTSCGASIKAGQNCMTHGQVELGYLFWRWKPSRCNLPRFDPSKFLSFLKDKHLAFVGDSMARNQLESLICLLSSAYPPTLVHTSGSDNKFRRWHFPSHNATVSIYWSPFLVKGVEKSISGPNHNKLYLDAIDDRWGSDLGSIDLIVLSIGHWYLHPAVYYEGRSVLGCHACDEIGMNHTEIGFYGVFRKAYRTALKSIVSTGGTIDVFLTTFSPSHFEGEWDKAGACPKTKPYKEGEKQVEGMDAEMRKIGLEEVKLAKEGKSDSGNVRINALDVTKLAILRPDAHPGPYMHPFPFANGVPERLQHDCLHWCLPGAIDTWNEIMLEVIRAKEHLKLT